MNPLKNLIDCKTRQDITKYFLRSIGDSLGILSTFNNGYFYKIANLQLKEVMNIQEDSTKEKVAIEEYDDLVSIFLEGSWKGFTYSVTLDELIKIIGEK